VILAGGFGTRIRDDSDVRPKPLVEIGEKPIIWHIMKNLANQGITDFIVALGYKGEQIKDFFINFNERTSDITIDTGSGTTTYHRSTMYDDWKVTLVSTGIATQTGGRLHLLRAFLGDEPFLCTYGDGLANLDLTKLIDFHKSHKKTATVTATIPKSRFGILDIDQYGRVTSFSEKAHTIQRVNGGFFLFEPQIFDYLNESCTLEKEPLENLALNAELMAYTHDGFWQPMDTMREAEELNSLWNQGLAPWKNW